MTASKKRYLHTQRPSQLPTGSSNYRKSVVTQDFLSKAKVNVKVFVGKSVDCNPNSPRQLTKHFRTIIFGSIYHDRKHAAG